MPTVLPPSSMPCCAFHSPARIARSWSVTRRATSSIKASACSATPRLLLPTLGDGDAAFARVRDIHVLDAGTGYANHLQPRAGVDYGGGKLRKGRPERQDDVGVAHARGQFASVGDMTAENLDLCFRPQPLGFRGTAIGAGDVVRDYDLHADARPIPCNGDRSDRDTQPLHIPNTARLAFY